MMKFLKSLLFQVEKSSRFGNLQHFLVRGNLEDYQILKIFRPEITKILKTSSLDGQLWRRLHRMSPSSASSITGAFAVVSAVRGGFVALLFFRNFLPAPSKIRSAPFPLKPGIVQKNTPCKLKIYLIFVSAFFLRSN